MGLGRPGVWLLLAAFGPSAQAQDVSAALYGAAVSNGEVSRDRQAHGLGIGADVAVELGRTRLEARGLTTALEAPSSEQRDYAMHELEMVATYRWRPPLSFQIAVERRFLSPDFAAQEVGLVRLGVHSETALSSLGLIAGYASYLPVTRFSGGGDGGFAVELGFGMRVGPPDGRFSGLLEYSYQRIDRTVSSRSASIAYSVARLGVRGRLTSGGRR
jgi:hypothetical protein